MKRVLCFCVVFFLSICVAVSSLAKTYTFDDWEVKHYTDDFDNETDKMYVVTKDLIKGTFSNSATMGSPAYAHIFDEKDYIQIRLFEYDSLIPASALKNESFTIKVNSKEGVSSFFGYMYGNDLMVLESGFKTAKKFRNILKSNTSIDISIKSDKYNTSYLFKNVQLKGFKNAYNVAFNGAPVPTSSVTKEGIEYYLDLTNKTATVISASKDLKNAIIPDKVSANKSSYKVIAISSKAFDGLKDLEKVNIGKYITSIPSNAFSNCPNLKSITGGSAVTSIGASAFQNCSSLSSFTIQSKVKSIGENAFNGCKNLLKINIKSRKLTASNVGNNAFSGISSKVTITCPAAKIRDYRTLLQSKGLSSSAVFSK